MERYSEYKDSGVEWIGEIPAGWSTGRISSLYEQRSEKVSDKDYQPLSVTMKGIVPQLETAAKTQDGDNRKLVRRGDFAINSRSDRRGSCGISPFDGSVSLITNVLAPIDRSKMDDKYYELLYQSEGFSDEYYRWGTGIVDDLWSTNWIRMKNILIPVPPVIEQSAIAAYLLGRTAEIDALVANQEKSIELLQEYRKAVISEVVTKGLDPNVLMKDSGVEWIGAINRSYQLGKLGLFSFVTKLAGFEYTDTMCSAISSEGDVPIVRAQNVRMIKNNLRSIHEYIDNATSLRLERCALTKKCLLITFIGAGIGDVCIFNERKRFHLAPNVAKIEIKNKAKLLEEFVMFYLASSAGIGEINKFSKASAQPSLSMETIRAVKVVIPSFDEQEQIVRYLNNKTAEIDSLIADKQQLISKLKEYRKSLISEAVTGKFKVPGVEEG